jgi:hypothetical protein
MKARGKETDEEELGGSCRAYAEELVMMERRRRRRLVALLLLCIISSISISASSI